jgi:hypothetical protein
MKLLLKNHFQLQRGIWNQEKFQEEYFLWISYKFQIDQPEGWYQINSNDVIVEGYGRTLIKRHGSCLGKLLMSLYPEYNWIPWMFEKSPNFSIRENLDSYLNWIKKKLYIKKEEDWYDVSLEHLKIMKGNSITREGYMGLIKVLQYHMPNRIWQMKYFDNSFDKSQRLLYRCIREIFHSGRQSL